MGEKQISQAASSAPHLVRNSLFYALLGVATIGVALLLWRLPLPFIRTFESLRQPAPPFQLFVFCATVALIVAATVALRRGKDAALGARVPIILLVLVGLHYLSFMRQHSARSWDYECYEQAAQAIVAGSNPYGGCYLYWPLVAQTMAVLHQLSALGLAALPTAGNTEAGQLWDLLFYLYEASQWLLIILAYFLCYRFARRVALNPLVAALLVAGLFVFNNPLVATITYNQVNLWVLNLVLLALLLWRTHPWLSGLAVALGGQIKLYPLIFLLPWTLTKQVRAVAGAAVGTLALVLIQTGGGRDWHLWSQFLAFAGTFPKGRYFRDNSLHSVIYNVYDQSVRGLGWPTTNLQATVDLLYSGAILLMCGYFLVRFVVRERAYAALADGGEQAAMDRFYGHTMDAVALGLIISPVVWEHHYVLAMPLVIWAVATQGHVHPWPVGIAAFLIFAIPTFDVFPVSYHRLVGLLYLVHLTWPAALPLQSPQPIPLSQVRELFKS